MTPFCFYNSVSQAAKNNNKYVDRLGRETVQIGSFEVLFNGLSSAYGERQSSKPFDQTILAQDLEIITEAFNVWRKDKSLASEPRDKDKV